VRAFDITTWVAMGSSQLGVIVSLRPRTLVGPIGCLPEGKPRVEKTLLCFLHMTTNGA
jgi:hypothetical protein